MQFLQKWHVDVDRLASVCHQKRMNMQKKLPGAKGSEPQLLYTLVHAGADLQEMRRVIEGSFEPG